MRWCRPSARSGAAPSAPSRAQCATSTWTLTTARNKAVDRLRRERVLAGKQEALARLVSRNDGMDAVVVATAVTWVVWCAYLGLRLLAGWAGRRAAYLALFGFALVVVVRVVISGSHFG